MVINQWASTILTSRLSNIDASSLCSLSAGELGPGFDTDLGRFKRLTNRVNIPDHVIIAWAILIVLPTTLPKYM